MIFGINFFGIKVYLEFFFDENINIIVVLLKKWFDILFIVWKYL